MKQSAVLSMPLILPDAIHSKTIKRPLPLPPDTKSREVPGHLITGYPLFLPFDSGTPLHKIPVGVIGGGATPFAGLLSQADIYEAELNLAVLMGKWFYVNYNPLGLDGTPIVSNRKVSQLSKKILFDPFDREVFVIARTVGTLPENPVTTVFRGWERCEIDIAGVQADVSTSIAYVKSDKRLAGDTIEQTVIRSVTRQQGDDAPDIYRPLFHQDCIFKLPAGTGEIVYHAQLSGQAFASREINDLIRNHILQQYALAMLDLRKQVTLIDDPIIMNPFSGDVWAPPGGVKLNVHFEFREVENPDGR
jgi:hypothetical protein